MNMRFNKALTFGVGLMLAGSISVNAQKVTFNGEQVSLKQAFQKIESVSKYKIAYNATQLDVNKTVTLNQKNVDVLKVLDAILAGTGCTYKINDGYIVITPIQKGTVKKIEGIVKDTKGEAVIGATVMVKGTTTGTITDFDGKFSLDVEEGSNLEISYVGFKNQELAARSGKLLSVILKEDTEVLDEVVVVGYGIMKKSDLTGSVSSLKSDDITKGYSLSPDMALRGKTAGVQIITQSGQPGSGGVVRIRGNSSILGSNEPLYVVDGIPLSGGGAAEGVGGVSSSPLTSINPSDIESMEVLKDASATAIYGSRGANGVVMITTKKGKNGKFSVNLNVSAGFQKVGHMLNFATPQQWAEMWNESMDYLNNGVGKYDLDNLPVQTNWLDAGYRTAFLQNYELSVSGGNDKLRYMISGGYSDQEGIVIGTDFKRYSLRTNIENKFNKWFTIGTNISATKTNTNSVVQGFIEGGTSPTVGNPLGILSLASPIQPIYDEDGNYNLYVDEEKKMENPIASLKEITNNDLRTRFISNVYVELAFLPELKFKSSIAVDASNAKANYYAPSYISEGLTSKGLAKIGIRNSMYWNFTNTLTYMKTFQNSHSLNAMIGLEWQKNQEESAFTQGSGFANDNAKYDNITEAENFSSKSNFNAWQMESYMTRINYSFKNRYSLTFTGRIDGSSRFGTNNKYAFFPSGAVAWRISEEDFMKKYSFISNLKMRLSYGSSGEQGINSYQTLSILNPLFVYIGKDLHTGYYPIRAADPSLKWERTNQFNAGLDLSLLNNRLNFTLDYYYKRTNDLLYYKALPGSSGFTSILKNIGSIDNKGFELSINALLINCKDFQWNMSINNSINRNKLISLGDGRNEIINPPGGISADGGKYNPSILRVGEPLGLFYGYVSEGVIFDEKESEIAKQKGQIKYSPGELKIKDLDGDGKITTKDKTIIGNANPDFSGGMTNSFSYKGFQLDILCDWVVGNDIMNYQHLFNQQIVIGANVTSDWYNNRWTLKQPSKTCPRAGYDVRAYPDVSYHVFDGSFFRINNITFSYSFPKSILNKIKVNSCRIFTALDNVYTFSKYPGWSPDVSVVGENVMGQGIDFASYPSPRTVSFGINLGF